MTHDNHLRRRVQELMTRPYTKLIRGEPTEGYLAEAPELPGCVTAGATEEEALRNLDEAMTGWLLVALERGISIPDPDAAPARRDS